MSARLGLGLLSGRLAPPQLASMITWIARTGKTVVGGKVTADASKVGSAVFTAAGAARPTDNGAYVSFDGIANILGRAADASSSPNGSSEMTLAHWVKPASLATDIVAYSGGQYATAPFISFSPTNIIFFSGAAGDQDVYASPATVGQWLFAATTFNGARGNNVKMRSYLGTSPANVALVSTVQTSTGATVSNAVGTSNVGGIDFFGRFWNGDIAGIGLYTKELSLAELKTLSAVLQP